MLIFSAITPHPLFLIPAIGKDNLKIIKKTAKSYKILEEELYASKPETIVIISPHGTSRSSSFSLNLNDEYLINFEKFGDFTTRKKIKGDISLAYKIRERLETKAPLQLISEEILDYGMGVPLYLLTQKLPKIKIVPIHHSGLDLKAHYEFGKTLNRDLTVTKKRVALIASGDLSHSLTKKSPAPYSPKAKKFDQKVVNSLKQKKVEDILQTNEKLSSDVHECGLKSFAILLGILEGTNYSTNFLSYEAPLGIGYLTMAFQF